MLANDSDIDGDTVVFDGLAGDPGSGTIELLTTKPLRDAEVVLGKFLAAWALIGLALVPTLLYAGTMAWLGDVDLGPVIGGYLGLLLMAAVYISLGLFASIAVVERVFMPWNRATDAGSAR